MIKEPLFALLWLNPDVGYINTACECDERGRESSGSGEVR